MRTWFEPLPFVRNKKDCDILNRAVRNMFPGKKQPSRSDLIDVRLAYVRGMSAADLVSRVEKS